jgi:hypothetical protein
MNSSASAPLSSRRLRELRTSSTAHRGYYRITSAIADINSNELGIVEMLETNGFVHLKNIYIYILIIGVSDLLFSAVCVARNNYIAL